MRDIGTLRLLITILLALQLSCKRAPPLVPYDERTNNQFREAPLVMLGVAEDDEFIGRPVQAKAELQLHRVTVHVENVLKGTIPEHTIALYYFTFANLNVDWRFLIFHRDAVRRVFWLQRDHGVYRTACDVQNCTVWIESGAHPNYRPPPDASIDRILVDLSLTRGDGPVDDYRFVQEMGRNLGRPGQDSFTIEKLRSLALTESSPVKAAACRWLRGYDSRWTPSDIRQRARDSAIAAGCACESVDAVCR